MPGIAHIPRAMQSIYQSEQNRGVSLAQPSEFKALPLGPLRVWPPVVLAPMAGVTNYPFRSLCREFGAGPVRERDDHGAARWCEGSDKTLQARRLRARTRAIRSLQLYGVDPYYVGEAVKRLVGEGRVDHIDLNFGCPVRKVTRRGGGAAIPLQAEAARRTSCARRSASAGHVPVTIKFRIGIDDEHLTYPGLRAASARKKAARAVALHARTAAQLYDGVARWDAIARAQAARAAHPGARQRRHLGGAKTRCA